MAKRSEPVRQVRRGVNGGDAVLDDGRSVVLADLPERAAARLLDPITVFVFALGTFANWYYFFFQRWGVMPGFGPPTPLAEIHEDVQRFGLKVSLVVFVILALYEISATTLPKQTRGKARRRVRVVSVDGEAVLSLGRVWLRAIVALVAGVGGSFAAVLVDFRYPALGGLVFWCLVYLSAMWGRVGRGIPDIVAGTVVIIDPEPDQTGTDTG